MLLSCPLQLLGVPKSPFPQATLCSACLESRLRIYFMISDEGKAWGWVGSQAFGSFISGLGQCFKADKDGGF